VEPWGNVDRIGRCIADGVDVVRNVGMQLPLTICYLPFLLVVRTSVAIVARYQNAKTKNQIEVIPVVDGLET
jgi:hypothetical protein